MKQIPEVEENLFPSSLNNCTEVCWDRKGGGRSNASPRRSRSVGISFKDDVTVILLLGFPFMGIYELTVRKLSIFSRVLMLYLFL